jgi:hypothetical protein
VAAPPSAITTQTAPHSPAVASAFIAVSAGRECPRVRMARRPRRSARLSARNTGLRIGRAPIAGEETEPIRKNPHLEGQATTAGARDPKLLAFEFQALAQGANSSFRLFGDPATFDRARKAIHAVTDDQV